MRHTRENKVNFPHDPNRPPEEITISEVCEDGSAIGVLRRLPQHTCRIDASIAAGLRVGDSVTVRAKKPEWFGFRNGGREWIGTELLETKGSGR